MIILSACTDLQENPISLLAPESFFSSRADAEAAVLGGYAPMASYFDYGGSYFIAVENPSEMVQNVYLTQSQVELNDFTYTSSNDIISNDVWQNEYLIISGANNAVDGIPLVKSMQDAEKSQLIAEAKALRAFTYFRLVRLFGDIPYLDEFVTDPSTVAELTRTPASDVYTYIIEDLEYAKQHLPNSYTSDLRSRISKGTAYTILADVYLTLGDWAKAAENAEYVINHAGDFGYALMDNFKDLYDGLTGDDLAEHVWSVDFENEVGLYPYNTWGFSAFFAPSGTDYDGWSVNTSNEGTLNSFDDRDYRKKVSFITEAPISGEMKPYTEFYAPRPHIGKYVTRNKSLYDGKDNWNVSIYRYAEVLLIAAEALNEVNGGPTSETYKYINQVRARARNYDGVQTDFPPDFQTGMSQGEFREAVLKERCFELAFEMKRWFDIKRRGMIMSVFGPDSPEPHPNVQPYHELFPIPQAERDKNPNLTQNPGYN